MTYLDTYNNALSSINDNDLRDLVLSKLIENEDSIRDMIKERWKTGIIHKNNTPDYYSRKSKYPVSGDEFYYIFKNNLNAIPGLGIVDLILTGALVESITTILKGTGVEVISTNWKYEIIGKHYGFDVYNITEEEQFELEDFIVNDLIMQITSAIWHNA